MKLKFLTRSAGVSLAIGLLAASTFAGAASGVYMAPEQFLSEAFPKASPTSATLWISGPLRDTTEKILAHPPSSARQRYWYAGDRSAWILDEIGKEKPITAGFVIQNDRIVAAHVLTFRESRGWEIRSPGFTAQFDGVRLQGADSDPGLDQSIDGISGATLSVRAMRKMAKLALTYHQTIMRNMAAHAAP